MRKLLIGLIHPLSWAEQIERKALVYAGMDLSWDDDQVNDRAIYKFFERSFFSAVQGTQCFHEDDGLQCPVGSGVLDESAWMALMDSLWELVDLADEVPSLAHGVATSLYSWFWWQGPHTDRVNVPGARAACSLMSRSLDFNHCRDPGLPLQDFYVRSCHMRWRYLLMIASELGRHLALTFRDPVAAATALRQASGYFEEMRRLPAFGPHAGPLRMPHEINFNSDFFPAAVARQGPIWEEPLRDLPIAAFLEDNFAVVLGELRAILAEEGLFDMMHQATRNAEPQFGPRDDDWRTAYLLRGGEFNEATCQFAPHTCDLLRGRPEVSECVAGLSGAGFLRLRPGGRLKPHFGNSPRISVHLALIVPPGEVSMSVGYRTVRWVEGKVLAFDDTFIHSVTHNGLEPRYVLLLWMCHPCDPTNGRSPGDSGEVPEYCDGPEQGVLPPDVNRQR